MLRARPAFEPYLKRFRLDWKQLAPLLEEISLEDLKEAIATPLQFLEEKAADASLAAVFGRDLEAGTDDLIAQLRPKLEAYMEKHGLQWEDVESLREPARVRAPGSDKARPRAPKSRSKRP